MKANHQALEINLKRFDLSILSVSEDERGARGVSDEPIKKPFTGQIY